MVLEPVEEETIEVVQDPVITKPEILYELNPANWALQPIAMLIPRLYC